MSKVCIALDYSPSATQVAEIGFAHAHMIHAEITLVHVVADAGYYQMGYSSIMGFEGYSLDTSVEVTEALQHTSREYLEKVVQHLGDKSINIRVLQGDTAEALLDFAEDWGADLIVLGTHSHSALENFFMGNTASSVVKHNKVPLLVIPVQDE